MEITRQRWSIYCRWLIFIFQKWRLAAILIFFQHNLAKSIKQCQKWTPHTLKPQKGHLTCHILRNKSKWSFSWCRPAAIFNLCKLCKLPKVARVATLLILIWDPYRLQISNKTSCYLKFLGCLLNKEGIQLDYRNNK